MSTAGTSSSIGGNDLGSFLRSLEGPGPDHPNRQIEAGASFDYEPHEQRVARERAERISLYGQSCSSKK